MAQRRRGSATEPGPVALLLRAARNDVDPIGMRAPRADLARTDALTGLANRLHLEERLAGELSRLRRAGGIGVLHRVGLHGLRRVNDRFGQGSGDRLLQEVALRLAGLRRGGDVVARIGGDGFAVLQAAPGHAGEAEFFARRIGRVIAVPFRIAGEEIEIGASVGAAIAPVDTASPETWLAAADAALARAKARGRSRIEIVRDGMAA